MPLSLLTRTVPGALVSLAAHLRNDARKAGDTEPQAPAQPPQAAAPAVRFDLSAPAAPAAGAPLPVLPAAPAASGDAPVPAASAATQANPVPAATLPPAFEAAAAPAVPPAAGALAATPALSRAALAPAAAGTAATAPAVLLRPAGRGAAQAGSGAGVSALQGAGASPAGSGVRRPDPAGLDDEAMARAWAIRTVARENTLSVIGRIARLAERPEPVEAAKDRPEPAPQAVEPRTLARV